jgi:predicted ATP-grasp superfamily ATP-dependent carboligase
MALLPERLLIAACSGRMLARSAARCGLRPVVLDLYADSDTRECAAACERAPPGRIGFEPTALLAAAERLAPPRSGYALAYGSGLDIDPDLLQRLGQGRAVYGNPPAVARLLKTPAAFFDLLRRLDIPHPEIRCEPPSQPRGWLFKPDCGEGGKGVVFCAQAAPASAGGYYQRRLPGPPLSALFLADGENARIVGFNTLWTCGQPDHPFLFAGAVNRADLSPEQRAQVGASIARLTQAVGLKGLNSLDFMLDGAACRVLEVNPRPSATLALYDADFPEGLLARHLRACCGELGDPWASGAVARAYRVVFAAQDIVAPAAWPEGCVDRPLPGSVVKAGEPFCSVEAEGRSRREAERWLRRRLAELALRLEPAPVGGASPDPPSARPPLFHDAGPAEPGCRSPETNPSPSSTPRQDNEHTNQGQR